MTITVSAEAGNFIGTEVKHNVKFSHSIVKFADFDGTSNSSSNSNQSDGIEAVTAVNGAISFAFGLFLLIITIRSRAYIRRKFNIPGNCLEGKEMHERDLSS